MSRICYVLLPALLGIFLVLNASRLTTFDEYYHFAVSRLILEQGVPLSVPQVDDLHWGKVFAEKEFLFHIFTAAFYALAGDEGVRLFCLLCAIGIVLVSFREVERQSGALLALLVVLLFYFFEPVFAYRLLHVRPHVLAILWMLLLTIGLSRSKPILAGCAALGFALSYHAFYLPLAVLVLSGVLRLASQEQRSCRSEVYAVLGIVLGTVANPYFPASWQIAWEHLLIAIKPSKEIPLYYVGNELWPIRWTTYFHTFWPHLAAIAIAAVILIRDIRAGKSFFPLACTTAAAILFLALTLKNARSLEYAIPFSLLAFSNAAAAITPKGRRFLGYWLLLALFVKSFAIFGFLHGKPPLDGKRIASALQAIERLPQQGSGKVFTCHWDVGSLLLYGKDHYQFVDLLDPRLLYYQNRSKALLRLAVFNGQVADPVAVAHNVFSAHYILCGSESVLPAMEQDPRLTRLYPEDRAPISYGYTPGLELALYRLNPLGSNGFVRKLEITPLDQHGKPLAAAKQLQLTEPQKENDIFNVFPDIGTWSRSAFLNISPSCYQIAISNAELQRLGSHRRLGLGVNTTAQIRRGERVLLDLPAGTAGTPIAEHIELSHPLLEQPPPVVVACPPSGKKSWGASISLWPTSPSQ